MRFILFTVLLCAFCAAPHSAKAQEGPQDNPVVLELFTSAYCADAPPVDKMFEKIVEEDSENIIALGCHIDMLGASGMPDNVEMDYQKYKSHLLTQMQRPCNQRHLLYSQYAGMDSGMPLMVMNAVQDVSGLGLTDLRNEMAERNSDVLRVPLKIAENQVEISFPPMTPPEPLHIWVFGTVKQEMMQPESGALAGQVLFHANHVKFIEHAGQWQGEKENLAFTLPDQAIDDVAVILQTGFPPQIIAAGKAEARKN